MLRNTDPKRPGERFLVRDSAQNLPSTTPSIAFLNALQGEFAEVFRFAGITSTSDDQLARSIERILYGFWSYGSRYSYSHSSYDVQLKAGERFTVHLGNLYRANIAGETFEQVLVSSFLDPIVMGCLTLKKEKNLLVIESSVDTSFYLFLEYGVVLLWNE